MEWVRRQHTEVLSSDNQEWVLHPGGNDALRVGSGGSGIYKGSSETSQFSDVCLMTWYSHPVPTIKECGQTLCMSDWILDVALGQFQGSPLCALSAPSLGELVRRLSAPSFGAGEIRTENARPSAGTLLLAHPNHIRRPGWSPFSSLHSHFGDCLVFTRTEGITGRSWE